MIHGDDAQIERGKRRRENVLGPEHVAANTPSSSDFMSDFAQLSLAVAWGGVWSDESLEVRTRSLVTVAMLACLGMEDELAVHIRGALNVGASADELRGLLLHVAVYAGFARARSAFRVASSVLEERSGGH